MNDYVDFSSLGDYCKEFESKGTGLQALPSGFLFARLDGRAFHRLTKNMQKPLDPKFRSLMTGTTRFLCHTWGASLAYTQSDEITLMWELPNPESEWVFGGKFHKINSLLAAEASILFTDLLRGSFPDGIRSATFDCRTWQVFSENDAFKMFFWRQWDAQKNAINSIAAEHFSQTELMCKNQKERIRMLAEKKVSIGDFPQSFLRGVFFHKKSERVPYSSLPRAEEIKAAAEKAGKALPSDFERKTYRDTTPALKWRYGGFKGLQALKEGTYEEYISGSPYEGPEAQITST